MHKVPVALAAFIVFLGCDASPPTSPRSYEMRIIVFALGAALLVEPTVLAEIERRVKAGEFDTNYTGTEIRS